MNSQNYKAVIFDMDGTILDTSLDLTKAINYAMEKCGHRHDFTKKEGCIFFGSGVKVALSRALAYEKGYSDDDLLTIGMPNGLSLDKKDEALVLELEKYYRPYYSSHNAIKTGPYIGINDALKVLKERGLHLAVVSNKPNDSVIALAQKYFPDLFEVAIGEQEGILRKPAKDMNLLALKKMGIKENEAIYIGDSEIDLLTAKNSNMACISVDWGFRDAEFLSKCGATTIVHEPKDLIKILTDSN